MILFRIRPKMKKTRIVPILLTVLAAHFVWIAATWDGMGYTKDEGYYFAASRDNYGWVKTWVSSTLKGNPLTAFRQPVVDRHWRNNHEHPPFCKTMQGLNHQIWYDWLGWFNYGNSHRMSTWVFTAVMVLFMVLLVTEWLGLPYALFAVLLLFTLPRVFFHTHLNTFDMPVVAVWFITIYAFRRGMESHRWAWLTGVLLGVGLATKNNAYFLPVVFAILYLVSTYRKDFFRSLASIPLSLKSARKWKLLLGFGLIAAPPLALLGGLGVFKTVVLLDLLLINLLLAFHCLRPHPTLPRHIAPILPPLFTAPLVFFMLWPWIWYDTAPRLANYFNRHLNPPAWETYYLHDIVVNPPPFAWHYPLVMSGFTIPAGALFLMLAGLAVLLFHGYFAAPLRCLWTRIRGLEWTQPEALLTRHPSRNAHPVVDSRFDQWLIVVNIALPILIIMNPKTPIYGGTKHWMTAMPYLCIAAAIALRGMVARLSPLLPGLRQKWAGVAVGLVLGLAAVVPGLAGIAHTHPHTLSYYNELMGGSIAAPEVGMQRTFWAASSRAVLPYLNEEVPHNGRIWWNNTPHDSFNAYKKDGFLRADIRRANRIENADFAVMNHWKFYTDGIYLLRQAFGARYAEHWTDIDGMPLTEVFRNHNKIPDARDKNARPSRRPQSPKP